MLCAERGAEARKEKGSLPLCKLCDSWPDRAEEFEAGWIRRQQQVERLDVLLIADIGCL